MTVNSRSPATQKALEAMGAHLKMARVKRRISVKSFAARVGVSQSTVIRLEKGDAGVSIGTLAMAFLVLGEIDRITELLDPGSDDTGLLLDRDALPKRIDDKRKTSSSAATDTRTESSSDQDDEGIGF